MSAAAPTLDVERSLVAPGELLACVDEVGRGALAGPVSVGLVIIDPYGAAPPEGIRDSKDLTPRAREALDPLVRAWVAAGAVGHASPAEIDALGIVAALRLAGRRAWDAALGTLGASVAVPRCVLLDGSHDWLTTPPADLFADPEPADADGLRALETLVTTRVKADRDCVGVGAASVLAKVERDALMAALDEDFPDFAWGRNKGYGSAAHRDAIRRLGPCEHHRRSWHLV